MTVRTSVPRLKDLRVTWGRNAVQAYKVVPTPEWCACVSVTVCLFIVNRFALAGRDSTLHNIKFQSPELQIIAQMMIWWTWLESDRVSGRNRRHVSAAHATEATLDLIASCSLGLRLCVSDELLAKGSKRNGAWRGKPERKQTSAASTADQTELLSAGNHPPSTLPRFLTCRFQPPSSNFIVPTPLRNSRTVVQKQVPRPGTTSTLVAVLVFFTRVLSSI
ncbi:hypothetical protein MMC22_011181 [Lobaria immixta]|nr:hypothetical protein [Lobaria immixta]